MLRLGSLSDQVETALKTEILQGTYAPGEKLSIDVLAAQWGVSTTPVRDAIKRLESAGFVRIAPRRGVYVATFDLDTFRNVFDLRIALECMAVTRATDTIPRDEIDRLVREILGARELLANGNPSLAIAHDRDLHNMVIQHCGNEKLIGIMQDLRDLIDWATATVIERHPQSYELAIPEHLEVAKAIQNRDPVTAERAMRRHLCNAFERTLEPQGPHVQRPPHAAPLHPS